MNAPKIKTEKNGDRTFGPFTWRRSDGGDRSDYRSECWELVAPSGLRLTHWGVKNYGGEPGPGFAGWKLVSGGPFDVAGAYRSLDEAIVGVTPWLVRRMRVEIRQRIAEGKKAAAVLAKLERRARAALRELPR